MVNRRSNRNRRRSPARRGRGFVIDYEMCQCALTDCENKGDCIGL
jgi:hypothetical protein